MHLCAQRNVCYVLVVVFTIHLLSPYTVYATSLPPQNVAIIMVDVVFKALAEDIHHVLVCHVLLVHPQPRRLLRQT